jgi:glycosyltransferase involved in cell wall biosynthesis
VTEPTDLVVRLDTSLPGSLRVGRGTAVFCNGICFHRHQEVRGLELLVDGVRHRPAAWRMPRLDVFQQMRQDPERRCYRSGFWATLPIAPPQRPGFVELQVAARLASGAELVVPLGRIEVAAAPEPPSHSTLAPNTIAICMAIFEPGMALFRAQVESLRTQTDTAWICLVSDDCSSPRRFAEIEAELAGDDRFVLTRTPQRLGPYRNFERVLGLVPVEAPLVALCDQDDRWHPDKLATLRGALGSAQLVYSDQRLVDAEGRVLHETLWQGRRNNHTNLASLLVANSITGAACLFRRELVDLSLPFPDTPGWQFHDHWLGLVALASGEVAYVDRPLYDYVQHGDAVVGQVTVGSPSERRSSRGWRSSYFYAYLAREVAAQALLIRCTAALTPPKRRALERFIAAAHSPLAATWLTARPLRALAGANETLGTEAELMHGIAWRYLIQLRSGRRRTPAGSPYDAACPPLTSDNLGQTRLARWRAGRR